MLARLVVSMAAGSAAVLVAAVLGLCASTLSLWVIPVIFITGLAFGSLGLIMTALSPSYDFFVYYMTLIITPMMLMVMDIQAELFKRRPGFGQKPERRLKRRELDAELQRERNWLHSSDRLRGWRRDWL